MKIAIAQLNYTVGNFEHNKFRVDANGENTFYKILTLEFIYS